MMVLLVIKQLKRKLGNNAEVVVENVSLENLSILFVLFVLRRSHVSDYVQELNKKLQSTVKFLILDWILL